ncbi:hypothetical protein GGF31_003670 [Allomyces arbusculus]|nr:hypothetical protein GGF31_003670 [Allomyces arbusculus]
MAPPLPNSARVLDPVISFPLSSRSTMRRPHCSHPLRPRRGPTAARLAPSLVPAATMMLLSLGVIFALVVLPARPAHAQPRLAGDLSTAANECLRYANASATFCNPQSSPAYNCQACLPASFDCIPTQSCPAYPSSATADNLFYLTGRTFDKSCAMKRVQSCTIKSCYVCDSQCQRALRDNGICAIDLVSIASPPGDNGTSTSTAPSVMAVPRTATINTAVPTATSGTSKDAVANPPESFWDSYKWPIVVGGAILMCGLIFAAVYWRVRSKRSADSAKAVATVAASISSLHSGPPQPKNSTATLPSGVGIPTRPYRPSGSNRPTSHMSGASSFQLMQDLANPPRSSGEVSSHADAVSQRILAQLDLEASATGTLKRIGSAPAGALATAGSAIAAQASSSRASGDVRYATPRHAPLAASIEPDPPSSRSINISLETSDASAARHANASSTTVPLVLGMQPNTHASGAPVPRIHPISSSTYAAGSSSSGAGTGSPLGRPEPAITQYEATLLGTVFRNNLLSKPAGNAEPAVARGTGVIPHTDLYSPPILEAMPVPPTPDPPSSSSEGSRQPMARPALIDRFARTHSEATMTSPASVLNAYTYGSDEETTIPRRTH